MLRNIPPKERAHSFAPTQQDRANATHVAANWAAKLNIKERCSYPPYGKIFLTYLVPFCVSSYGAISQNDSTLRAGSVESKLVSVASKGDAQ